MRKLLLAAAALPLFVASAAQAQSADWTGAYVGASVGYADRSDSTGETIVFDTNLDGQFGDTVRTGAGADAFSPGFCGGSYLTNAAGGGCTKDDDNDTELAVRLGYDYQMGSFVVGGLVEYGRLELQDTVTGFSTTPAGYTFNRKLTDVFAVRARGGYAFGPNLVYATGGYAQGNMKQSFNTTNGANAFNTSGGGDAKGYQLGLGYERKLTDNVTLGVEWLRTDLKDDDFRVRAGNSGTTPATNPFLLVNASGTDFARTDEDFEFNSFRVTAAFRF
ncbi:MAG: outer membrane beta-barrel protein [Phenylobacterium sp.]|nr:outer membrane beta-barrel protein [Phenylobacterium sp.]